ncbi:MAG: threonylcarbamoyl-AMP synthase [Lachnospiraceae bacterium]|nr:threonylcarbamoyl-AMP synthase [Lachnospiraceae bacterium]
MEDMWLSSVLQAPAACLKDGGLVAFPTETVYGLGANALNETAAKRIYAAKGRPSDNPLIVHISQVEDMEILGHVNAKALQLAEAFWPGPLTIILPKKDVVPHETTGGLNTVAIRMPSHPAALELIRQSGVYVAAPSANTSGRPSPTKASHVIEDMKGKIEYIVDGGPVGIGIESTIVDVSGEIPMILRPGFITKKMIENIIGEVSIDPSLVHSEEGIRPKAPGMKYTHYAPQGELTLVESAQGNVGTKTKGTVFSNQPVKQVVETIQALAKERQKEGCKVGIMAPKETISYYDGFADVCVCVGDRSKQQTVAAGLYGALREFDAAGVDYIYAESFRGDELSDAIMNRLLKAAGHRVIQV